MNDPGNSSTVWILGAGFSQALNAPLFRDLFKSDHRVKAACGHSPSGSILQALGLYRRYASSEVGGEGSENGTLWRDPEEFLDVIESASGGAISYREFLAAAGIAPETDTFADWGRRALAMECSHFLKGANLETERWRPYVLWASELASNDTVVTFNYDQIPDLLSKNPARSPQPNLEVVIPKGSTNDVIEENVQLVRRRGQAPVFKLHGSVDWVASADGGIELAAASEDLATGRCPILGIPGPRKAAIRKEYKGMRVLWAYALEAIRKATRVVFVGYRFPPTDAEARLSILEALREAGSALKVVEVVLGPDLNHRDVARMRGLLSFVMSSEKVRVRPLFAEDFLPYGAA